MNNRSFAKQPFDVQEIKDILVENKMMGEYNIVFAEQIKKQALKRKLVPSKPAKDSWHHPNAPRPLTEQSSRNFCINEKPDNHSSATKVPWPVNKYNYDSIRFSRSRVSV